MLVRVLWTTLQATLYWSTEVRSTTVNTSGQLPRTKEVTRRVLYLESKLQET